MNKKLRYFFSFFVGNLVFFFLNAFINWALTFFRITPYGRFVATFFKGRTSDEAKVFIEANKELFNQMLPPATQFSNMVIIPTAGLVTGIVVGLIMAAKNTTTGVIWSLVTVAPLAVTFWVKSAGEPSRAFYVALFLVISGAGGFLGARIMAKK